MKKLAIISMVLTMLGAPTVAMAFGHDKAPATEAARLHNQQHAAEEFRFTTGLVEHGQNLAVFLSIPAVQAAAAEFAHIPQVAGYAQQVAQGLPCANAAPADAFSNPENPAHYGCVHPLTDTTVNLAALLTKVAPESPAVLRMNNELATNRQLHGNSEICAYSSYVEERQKELHGELETQHNPPDNLLLNLLACFAACVIGLGLLARMRRTA